MSILRCGHPFRLSTAILICASLLVACSGSSDARKDGTPQARGERAVGISTAVAEARNVLLHIQTTGSFVPEESSDVSPQTSGWVAATPVDVGAFIRQGELLVRLDDRDARLRLDQALAAEQQAEASVRQAQTKIGLNAEDAFDASRVPEVQGALAALESAEAQAKLAAADEKRYANLVQTGDVSLSNYERTRTQAETAQAETNAARRRYETALNTARQNYQGIETNQASLAGVRAQVAMARKALEDTAIRAPISGYVSARPVAVGEYVMNSSRVATVLRANPIKLHLQIPEAESSRVLSGMEVLARVSAFGEREFRGQVTAVNPAVNPDSRAITVESRFQNSEFLLRPGMFATARILLKGEEKAVFVPDTALYADTITGSTQVYVMERDKARLRVVQTGLKEGGSVRILKGVSAGEVVATNNLEKLRDGASVGIQEH